MSPDFYEKMRAKTEYLVDGEAYNAYEYLVCYRQWYTDKEFRQQNPSYWFTIGYINERPINIEIAWVELKGHIIGFYTSNSQLVDWKMIDEWLDTNYKGVPRTNHMNIHHVCNYIKDHEKSNEPAATS